MRSTERECPFCGAPLAQAAPRARLTERVGSVAFFTFALGAGLGACGGISDKEPEHQPPLVEADGGDSTDTGSQDASAVPDATPGDVPIMDAGTVMDSGIQIDDAGSDPYDPYDGGPVPIYKAIPKG